MRFAQLVMGPAGSGKSTYCAAIADHAATTNRVIHVVNLDPAAEFFNYNPIIDVRDLISVDDVMEDEDLNYGPNGGLIYCMEYLVKSDEWLREEIGDSDDDYILFDCPGQIELYTHMNVMKQFISLLQSLNFTVCGIFLVDAQFMVDGARFLSGTLAALSAMINLEVSHLNILSKMDQLDKSQRKELDMYLDPDPHELLGAVERKCTWSEKYHKLTQAIGQLIEDYSLVRFYPLNIKSQSNLGDILLTIDNMIQFGEDADVKINDFDAVEDDDGD